MPKLVSCVSAFCLFAAPAFAASAVTYVSVAGNDANSCASPAAPCRTFQRAVDQTSLDGEVLALTPGNYSRVQITKGVSITGVPGAGIFSTDTQNFLVAINAGANDKVYLAGLTLRGGEGAIGNIGASQIIVKKCETSNAFSTGIGTTGPLVAEDVSVSSVISNSSAVIAINVGIVLNRVDAVSSNIPGGIIEGFAISGGRAMIVDSDSQNNFRGIAANSSANVFVHRSTITSNVFGVFNASLVSSSKTNFIRGNNQNSDGPINQLGMR